MRECRAEGHSLSVGEILGVSSRGVAATWRGVPPSLVPGSGEPDTGLGAAVTVCPFGVRAQYGYGPSLSGGRAPRSPVSRCPRSPLPGRGLSCALYSAERSFLSLAPRRTRAQRPRSHGSRAAASLRMCVARPRPMGRAKPVR